MNDDFRVPADAEDLLVLAGEKLSEEVFERFTSGQITRERLQEVYKDLSTWQRQTEQILDALKEV